MTRVSVIIPTFNRARYIGAAIESALGQEGAEAEVIVIDDGSTDNTAAVMQVYRGRVLYRQQTHTGRPALARNAGLELASGEYVAFLDSDDLYAPSRLTRHVQALEQQPDVALVYSDAEYFTDDGRTVGRLLGEAEAFWGNVFIPLLISNFMPTCSVTLRKDCLAEAGGFDPDPVLRGVEDYDLWLRVASRHEIGFVPGALSRVRVHAENISGGDKLGQYLGILKIMDKMGRLYPDLVKPCRRRWRQRRALMHLAAARAYMRRGQPWLVITQAASAFTAAPEPRWLAYLCMTPQPARQWLTETLKELREKK